jgi:hypothetical protein
MDHVCDVLTATAQLRAIERRKVKAQVSSVVLAAHARSDTAIRTAGVVAIWNSDGREAVAAPFPSGGTFRALRASCGKAQRSG